MLYVLKIHRLEHDDISLFVFSPIEPIFSYYFLFWFQSFVSRYVRVRFSNARNNSKQGEMRE